MIPYFAYLIHFFVTLFIGGIFSIGLWISRDGEMEKLPNGHEKYKWRMILYPFYRWLTKPYKEKEYYFKEHMDKLLLETAKWFPNKKLDYLSMEGIKAYKLSDLQKQEWLDVACKLEDEYEIKITIKDNILEAWKEYERSREWAKPLIGCYKCYASFWGTILFWISTFLAVRTEFIELDFVILIPTWLAYCVCLVTVNVYIEKPTRDV